MSRVTEEQSVSQQVDTILKNRFRRFKYLQRHNRMEDAIAVADEFLEWLDPEYFDRAEDDAISYYCEDEMDEVHDVILTEVMDEFNNENE